MYIRKDRQTDIETGFTVALPVYDEPAIVEYTRYKATFSVSFRCFYISYVERLLVAYVDKCE